MVRVGEKLSIVLMCVVALMVPIFRSTEHIRNCVRSSVWKCVCFSITPCGWRYVLFYCHLRLDPLYCIMLCYVMSCHVMSCHVILLH